MKNALEDTGNRAQHMEESISELNGRNLEMIQVEKEREVRYFKNEKILQELCDSFRKGNIRIMGILKEEEREKGAKRLFKERTVENFPNLEKELEIQVHEAQRTPNHLNAKDLLQDIILKLLKVNDKERILKTAMEKRIVTTKDLPLGYQQISQQKPYMPVGSGMTFSKY